MKYPRKLIIPEDTEFVKNIFIYVSDALRYDHVPETIEKEGEVIPTLVHAGYTPISFSSLLTGLDPREHSVRSFYDTLEEETAFDLFENHSFYDHPEDALCVNIFQDYNTAVELENLEEPFLYVERALDTHEPYAQIGHGNEIGDGDMEGGLKDRYREGVKSTEEHFWSHIQELKDKGLYEDTLVIFTSDHGEWLGERVLGRKRTGHNIPVRKELAQVPTVFLNHDLDVEKMRSMDILPTALSITGREKIGDGLDVREKEPETGHFMLQINTSPLVVTGSDFRFRDGEWRPESTLLSDIGTIGIDLLDPLREKLRDTVIAEKLRPDEKPSKRGNTREEDEEDIDGIDF